VSARIERIVIVSGQLLAVVAMLFIWHALVTTGTVNSFHIGSPVTTWETLWTWLADGTLLTNASVTVLEAAIGWTVGILVGTAIGMAIGMFRPLGILTEPFFTFWNGFPRLAFFPFFTLVLGFTFTARVVSVVFVILFLVITQTASGVRQVDRVLLSNIKFLGAGRLELLREVYLPSSVTWVITSARFTVAFALHAAILAEFIGASSGIGYLTILGQQRFNVSMVWAAVITVVAVAVIVDLALVQAQRYLTRWAPV
jgi:ABC-type nitrate/sulfonate/bicarbonate transport system permease component